MFVATFVRHGETKLNAAKIVQSRTHGELSERGIKMAEHLGRHWAHQKFTRVFSSDLQRCHETTLNILKHSSHPPPELVLEAMLRERDYGELEFQPTQLIFDICNETGLDTHAIPLPGGEPYEETKKRTAKFFSMLCTLADSATEPEHILACTHGAWLMTLMDYLAECKDENLELEGFKEEWLKTGPHNTATTSFVIHKLEDANVDAKRKVEVLHFYDTTHLPDHLQKN